MPPADAHLRALLAALRAALDAYREQVVLAAADPRFQRALESATQIDGYTTPAELCLLYHLALAAEGPGAVVEIGSYLGRSTVVLAQACADKGREPVAAVDPHTAALGIEGAAARDTRGDFLRNVAAAGLTEHVRLFHMTSAQAAEQWPGEPIRLHFVDGWHSREAVLLDVGAWARWFTPECVAVFDDFMVSDGVRQAVRELQGRGVLRRDGLVAGKMAAFGPPDLLRRVPAPPGGRLVTRLSDRAFERAVRLAAR